MFLSFDVNLQHACAANALLKCFFGEMGGRGGNESKEYLLLDAIELQHLDDEGGGASFVLNGPEQRSDVIHAERLGPAPVPPALDADVQQLKNKEKEKETKATRKHTLVFLKRNKK